MAPTFPIARAAKARHGARMVASLLLLLIAVLYRVILGIAGSAHLDWLHNFSPLAAIALCGAIYLPRRAAIVVPLLALFISDLCLNAHYHVPLVSVRMLPEYLALGLSVAMGLRLRARPGLAPIVGASLLGSIAFYLITNTGDWLADPGYAKTGAGLWQALTTGLPQYPSTLVFFRHTVVSDLLFTLLFVACMAVQPAPCTVRSKAAA